MRNRHHRWKLPQPHPSPTIIKRHEEFESGTNTRMKNPHIPIGRYMRQQNKRSQKFSTLSIQIPKHRVGDKHRMYIMRGSAPGSKSGRRSGISYHHNRVSQICESVATNHAGYSSLNLASRNRGINIVRPFRKRSPKGHGVSNTPCMGNP